MAQNVVGAFQLVFKVFLCLFACLVLHLGNLKVFFLDLELEIFGLLLELSKLETHGAFSGSILRLIRRGWLGSSKACLLGALGILTDLPSRLLRHLLLTSFVSAIFRIGSLDASIVHRKHCGLTLSAAGFRSSWCIIVLLELNFLLQLILDLLNLNQNHLGVDQLWLLSHLDQTGQALKLNLGNGVWTQTLLVFLEDEV